MPRGWHYKQEGYEKPIRGYSRINLIDEIGKFRISNGLPLGNPEEDLEAYACSRWPRICAPDYSEPTLEDEVQELAEKDNRTALEEIRLNAKYHSYQKSARGRTLVTAEEAEKRAAICADCSQNRTFSQLSHCSGCIVELNRQSTMTTEAKKLGVKIGWCADVLTDTRTMAWLPKEALERQLGRVNDTVENCWLRQIQ